MQDDIEVEQLKKALTRCMGDRMRLFKIVERMANPEPGDTFRALRAEARKMLANDA